MAFALLRYLAFAAFAIVGPGMALQRLARLPVDAALVLPTGAAFAAAAYALSGWSGLPWIFPAAVLLANAVLVWRGLGRRAEGDPSLRGALPACLGIVLFLALTQYGWNRTGPDGGFRLDPMGDHPLHAGATWELTLPWPPQVPGLAGVPLDYHLGADLVRAAALRWAGVDPYDSISRFEVTLWALALALALRAAAVRLAAPPLAVALAPWAPLAADASFLLAPFLPLAFWGDLFRGNLLLSLCFDNPVVLGLAMALAALVALSRFEGGEGRGFLVIAALLVVATAQVKVFTAAQLALGLGWAALAGKSRKAPLLLAALALAAVGTLVLGSGGARVGVTLAPLDLVRISVRDLGLSSPSGGALLAWAAPWLLLSLGLRLVGVREAFAALRGPQSLPAALGVVALSGWPLGLLFHAAANDLQGRPLPSALIYLLEQSGCVLWLFTAVVLARFASRQRRPALVPLAAAALCFPAAIELMGRRLELPADEIGPALMAGQRALREASRPGDLVLQRPGWERPALPVILSGRRVLLEGYTPYLTQFTSGAELRRRRQVLASFFRAETSEEALGLARETGASFVCLYGDQSLAFAPAPWLRPLHDHAQIRVFRIEPPPALRP